MRLIDHVKSFHPDMVLLRGATEDCTVGQLLAAKKCLSGRLLGFQGKNLVLNFRNNFTLARWLLFLDGIAARMTIIVDETSSAQKEKFIELTECDILLTDFANDCPGIHSFNVHDFSIADSAELGENTRVETQWVLTTSGTTGTPKLVKHTLSSLTNTVKSASTTQENIWGLLYDIQRFAGLQVFLQALLSCNTLVVTEQEQSLSQRIALFKKCAVNCLSATPTLWRKILMVTASEDLSFRVITLGGEIADKHILKALSQRFPQAKIRHIYASTEAGAGFSVADKLPGFPKGYLYDSLTDVSLKISDENTLLIKSRSESDGYIGDEKLAVNDGYINTGDVIEVVGDRCYFHGRENGSINVGGNKVQPEHVERVLMDFPGVQIASVTAKKSPIMGSLVQAKIVVATSVSDHKKFIGELRQFSNSQLEKFMVPALFKIVDDISINSTGKVLRNE